MDAMSFDAVCYTHLDVYKRQNYDSTTTQPTLLPVTFPTILSNNTLGIAVGMACNICSFNLAELCATTVALMKRCV